MVRKCWVWFASCLAETNRTPFDFAEGESESGELKGERKENY